MFSPFRLVLVTAPPSEATALASALVEEQLCACVNVLPAVNSVYRWQGKVTSDPESLMLIKTTHDGAAAVRAFVESKHSYDTPEILALDIDADASSTKYLQWLAGSVLTEAKK